MKKPTLSSQKDARRSAERAAEASEDPRVYVTVHQLMQLKARGAGLSFLPRQPVHSLLSGRHASRIRGRGLNFEEIRDYHPGDDVRMIDWKVTARTRSPHTRVFTEERDRSAILIVDQRVGMFYGTKWNMKSVTAAQVAAISAWRVLDVGDRVGAIIIDDDEVVEIRPQRSRDTVIRILKTISEFNHRLQADSTATPNPTMLTKALEQANRTAKHDSLVVVVSDFFGFDEAARRELMRLSYHNDVIVALVHDPSASGLSTSQNFVVTNGELHIELPVESGRERKRIEEASRGRIAEVLDLAVKLPVVTLPISAGEPVEQQLQKLLGSSPTAGAARFSR